MWVTLATEGANVESATQTLPAKEPAAVTESPLAQARSRKVARPKPELTRQERVASAAYLAMIALIVAFLAVAALLASLGA
jgi:hypothetical protein